MRRLATLHLLAAMALGCGCNGNHGTQAPVADLKTVELLLPSGIEIIEPFTRVASFDDDPAPDGIEVMLQAVNPLDSPCTTLVGSVRVELYEFVPASADRKGRRIEHWNVDIKDADQQRRYWNRMTQMYEFRLGLDTARVPPAEKYVLQVTYTSPLGGHFADEFVLEPQRAAFRPPGS